MRIVLAALLGAVAMFMWEFVAHAFTPLGTMGMGYLPKEDTISSALESAIGKERGLYMFPTGGLTKQSTAEEEEKGMERMMEEMKTKPSGLVLYKAPGERFNFGANLAIQFVTDFVKLLLAVWLLAQTRFGTFGGRVAFITVAGVVAAITTNIPHWNWYGYPGDFTAAQIIMDVVGFLIAGLVIAFMFRRAPATA